MPFKNSHLSVARFSIYKLTQIVQYFPPMLLDKLMTLMKEQWWKFTKGFSVFPVTLRLNYKGNILTRVQHNARNVLDQNVC